MFSFLKNDSKMIGFQDVQIAIKNKNEYLIVNTLSIDEQKCLIVGTIDAESEESVLNSMINTFEQPDKKIVLYGKNSIDKSVDIKAKQLNKLGISDVFIYKGGLFEWMILQDIYGCDEFPTTMNVLDILLYKPNKVFDS